MRARNLPRIARVLLVFAVFTACGEDDTPGERPAARWDFGLPEHAPPPVVPADNPMNADKVELGRRLFYDVRLSRNETQSCGSCHEQALAFTDGLATSVGSTGAVHRRSSMALVNLAYLPVYTWASNTIDTLEEQALIPLFGEDPVELGMAGAEDLLLERLRADPLYRDLFPRAFPEEAEPISVGSVVRAIAAFQRTLLSFSSPYDRFVAGEEAALSPAAQRGMELFFSEVFECHHCHGTVTFTNSIVWDGKRAEVSFHNTALYNLDGEGAYPARDPGLYEVTNLPQHMGAFRTPTLRNIEVTAPYMHDGSIATLEEVIDAHYARGGRLIEAGPDAGDGATSPIKSGFVRGFTMSETDRDDLIAFLKSLTDEAFLTDPRFANPW